MIKSFNLTLVMLLCMFFSVVTTSCGKDGEKEPKDPNSIVGTWVKDVSSDNFYDIYTLEFRKDHTGYIRNEYGTRSSDQMNFDWSLNTTSNGQKLLSVIYTSGDRYVEGPFEGGYAQYNKIVTIAGNTLSIQIDDSTVMLFQRQ